MFTIAGLLGFLVLLVITLSVVGAVSFLLFSIGGTLMTIIFSDVIVALAIIWFLFFRKKNK